MNQFIIWGPNKLKGEIRVLGAKNAAMKMIAAAVLIPGKVVLENVPNILDIQTIISILTQNGAQINRIGSRLEIDTTTLRDTNPNPKLVEKMRGVIVLIGPYLARFGRISIPKPGGCVIGSRPIETHLDAFRQIGSKITQDGTYFDLSLDKIESKVITLKEASVTATENILMLAVKSSRKIIIKNAAKEPEIIDLANFLNKSGGKILGAGSSKITIEGVNKLGPVKYEVMPDRIETGTFAVLAVATRSPLKITHCRPSDIQAFLTKLNEIGVKYDAGSDWLSITKIPELKSTEISTDIYPGFPTDLQAPMGLILTQTEGESKIYENLFENRLNYLKELEKMGAKVEIINNKEANIYGPVHLTGTNLESLDLRSGVTMILAALAATGKTIISNIEIVDRGYEKIEDRLSDLGAKIKRLNL